MARDTMDDLRDHLFIAIEDIQNAVDDGKELDQAIAKAKAIKSIADSLINSAKVEIQFRELVSREFDTDVGSSRLLTTGKVNGSNGK